MSLSNVWTNSVERSRGLSSSRAKINLGKMDVLRNDIDPAASWIEAPTLRFRLELRVKLT